MNLGLITSVNSAKNNAPLTKRIVVKLAGSMSVSTSAQRHNTEFPANAHMAMSV